MESPGRATFTPTDDIEDATNVITVGTNADRHGRQRAGCQQANTTANYTIDTKEPVITSVTMLSDSALKVGETVDADDHLQRSRDRTSTTADISTREWHADSRLAVVMDAWHHLDRNLYPDRRHRRRHQRNQCRHDIDRPGRQRAAGRSPVRPIM